MGELEVEMEAELEKEEHISHHQKLHRSLAELVKDFAMYHSGPYTIDELIEWSGKQTEEADHIFKHNFQP